MSITPEQLASSNTEHGEQSALCCWAARSGIAELKWLFAIPNGFFSIPAQKAKMKAEGLRAGVADLMLPVQSICGQHYGLFIEMKRNDRARLSDEQREFGEFVTGQGYKFVVCYSWKEARDEILKYLGRLQDGS